MHGETVKFRIILTYFCWSRAFIFFSKFCLLVVKEITSYAFKSAIHFVLHTVINACTGMSNTTLNCFVVKAL